MNQLNYHTNPRCIAKGKVNGKFNMFKLSDNRIWLVTLDSVWDSNQGSYIYEDGVFWPGFEPPTTGAAFSGFSVVQLDTKENKDKFFISGGLIGTGRSTKAFEFDGQVTILHFKTQRPMTCFILFKNQNEFTEVPNMPVHLSEHSSAIVRGKRNGTEIILVMGKSGSIANTDSYFYNLAKGEWRKGAGVPTAFKNEKITYDHVCSITLLLTIFFVQYHCYWYKTQKS